MSLNNLGIRLSDLGRRDDALAAAQETVDIRRHLAQAWPDAFLSDLAVSLGAMSRVLADLERHREAARTATEALEVLAPFVENYPLAFRDVASALGADILRYCEAAGQQPDLALLDRVAKALDAT
jgi:tetratricopeptide (TPR) repeat protein